MNQWFEFYPYDLSLNSGDALEAAKFMFQDCPLSPEETADLARSYMMGFDCGMHFQEAKP